MCEKKQTENKLDPFTGKDAMIIALVVLLLSTVGFGLGAYMTSGYLDKAKADLLKQERKTRKVYEEKHIESLEIINLKGDNMGLRQQNLDLKIELAKLEAYKNCPRPIRQQ